MFSFVSIHQDSHLVRECIHGVISVCGAFGGSPLASVMTTDHLYIRGIGFFLSFSLSLSLFLTLFPTQSNS